MKIFVNFKVESFVMDIQAEKIALIKKVEKINDLSLIQAIKHLVDFGLKKEDESISAEQYNKELEDADAEIEKGNYLSHEEALTQIRSWREK